MIQHLLPHQARFIASQNTFSAPFTGIYDFSIPANDKQLVIEMSPGITYFIDNFSFAGNITQEDFLSAVSIVPALVMSRRNDKDHIFTKSIPLNQFAPDKPATVFVSSTKKNDALLLTLTGKLNQVANIIGVSPVNLTISFSIYAIDNNEYNRALSDRLAPSFARRINQ